METPPPYGPPPLPPPGEVRRALRALDDAGLRRALRTTPGAGVRFPLGDGREGVSFASNDYLALAGEARLALALEAGAREEGAGAGAARLLAGARPAHEALEREAAAFKGTGAALLFGSGYLANLSVIPALAGAGDLVVSDALNHASLVDGCRLSRAEVRIVPHGDADAVRRALASPRSGRRVVVTEGLFSMEGDVAPLAGVVAAARETGALVIVDDAHGHGVLGATGGGAREAAGVEPADDLVEVGTFGKAFGGYGAFVAWTPDGVELLRHRARGFVFSTALPPGVAAMDLAGMRLARAEPERRERLRANVARLRAGLEAAGLAPGGVPESPILPLVLGTPDAATAAAGHLLERGFWIPAIRPPTVPRGTSRLRLSVSAGHSDADLDGAAAALAEVLGG